MINKVMLIGRLGADPEVKKTKNGDSFCNLSLATNKKIKDNEKISQKCKKKFYVSPFMDMETFYNFKLLNPDDKLSVYIKQTDRVGTILTATQTGEKKEFTSKQLIKNFFKYPLMTIKIIGSIHYEALLLWKKGAIYRKKNNKIKNNLSYEEY